MATLLGKMEQYRFPRSKKRRIRQKWAKDRMNWRYVWNWGLDEETGDVVDKVVFKGSCEVERGDGFVAYIDPQIEAQLTVLIPASAPFAIQKSGARYYPNVTSA